MPAGDHWRLCDHDRPPAPARAGGTNDADLLNEGSGGSEAINADVDLFMSNDNTYCGPVPGGTGGLSAVYQLDTAITFDL
jgi:hypothetical protein